jgi:capping protein alpha
LSLPSTIIQSSPAPSAAKVLALVESEEGEYQTSLTETYQGMSEKTYKSLRRALPMTRSKMDWDKVFEAPFDVPRTDEN